MPNPDRNTDTPDDMDGDDMLMHAIKHNARQLSSIAVSVSPSPAAAMATMHLAMAGLLLSLKRPDVALDEVVRLNNEKFAKLVKSMKRDHNDAEAIRAVSGEMDRRATVIAFPDNGSIN